MKSKCNADRFPVEGSVRKDGLAMVSSRIAVSIVALGLVAVLASGCGRRAALDTPSEAARAAAAKETQGEAEQSEKKKPERRFILDGLIE